VAINFNFSSFEPKVWQAFLSAALVSCWLWLSSIPAVSAF